MSLQRGDRLAFDETAAKGRFVIGSTSMTSHPERKPPNYSVQPEPGLFDAMADVAHVDLQLVEQGGSGEAISRARKRCEECEAVEECEAWLETKVGIPLPPAFCPNAPFFHLCIAAKNDPTFEPP